MMLRAFSREVPAYMINIFINLKNFKLWKLQKKFIVATEETMAMLY